MVLCVCVLLHILAQFRIYVLKRDHQKKCCLKQVEAMNDKVLLCYPRMLNGLYSNLKVPILQLRVEKSFPFKTSIFSSSYIYFNIPFAGFLCFISISAHIVRLAQIHWANPETFKCGRAFFSQRMFLKWINFKILIIQMVRSLIQVMLLYDLK